MGSTKRQLGLLVLVNLVASAFHGTHNVLFFRDYPEPPWISGPHVVELLYLLAMPFLWLGWQLFARGRMWEALAAFTAYGVPAASALGHYRYGRFADLAPWMNTLILFQGVSGIVLMLYAAVMLPGSDPPVPAIDAPRPRRVPSA